MSEKVKGQPYMHFIDDEGCEISTIYRHLEMPDGDTVYYPEDMWPPVPGQRCRPHVAVGPDSRALESGFLGAFYPAGVEDEAAQKRTARDAGITEFRPQIRPFADQLYNQGLIELTEAEQAYFREKGTIATEASIS